MWDMCQMLNIWQISHTKHKKQLPSDVAYMPKLYHLCLYHCKFATVRTNVVKRNNVLYLAFSLLSLLVLISSLSLLTSDPASLNRKRTKWHSGLDRVLGVRFGLILVFEFGLIGLADFGWSGFDCSVCLSCFFFFW